MAYHVSIRVDATLYQAISEAVQSAKLGEDFHHANISDFIREALIDYKNGMKLTAPPQADRQMKITSVCLTAPLYDFWRSLPRRQRLEILGRALETKLKRM